MSVPKIPEPARLVLSILTPDKGIVDMAAPAIEQALGPVEEEIGPMNFEFTSYYDKEMGLGIRRWIWAFADLVDRADLAGIKSLTNEIEQSYTVEGKRRFNLDPGLMSLGNFVLATGKDNAHRIYLGQGIFGDLTLIFQGGSYRPLEWTYPDYADSELVRVLNELRQTYKCKLAQLEK
ncbi:MAG: DUF4416 family protein [Desulfomonile tiedjei]|nr:DUF4416 family protein [Desulfomonile tiedjei]